MPHKAAEALEVLKQQVARTKNQIRKLNEDSKHIDMEQELAANEFVSKHFQNLRLEGHPSAKISSNAAWEKVMQHIDQHMPPELEEQCRRDAMKLSATSRPPPPPPVSTDMDDETWQVMQQQIQINNEIIHLLHEEMELKNQIIDMITIRIAERMKKRPRAPKKKD